jgi:UDP-N-acetylglucosamine 2-epimerase (non-hydrolysing)
MKEVLMTHMERIKASHILKKLNLKKEQYFLVSIHREENVDNSKNFLKLLAALEGISSEYNLPVIVSTHPRTRKRLKSLGKRKTSEKIRFLKPFGFLDYVHLQMNAKCVVSDSGTICEESAILSFPAITVRNAIERPEAIDAGTIVMTGLDPSVIMAAVKLQISRDIKNTTYQVPFEYEITNTSHRVVKLIIGTAKLSHIWDNIKPNDLAF